MNDQEMSAPFAAAMLQRMVEDLDAAAADNIDQSDKFYLVHAADQLRHIINACELPTADSPEDFAESDELSGRVELA